MVSQITDGTAFDKRGRPFRRRNYLPAAVMFVVLFIGAAMIWVMALNRTDEVAQAEACNAPPAPTDANQVPLGRPASKTTMMEAAPARLADTKVTVLNASGQGGQAADIADSLRDLGFAEPTAANDPVYVNTRLLCTAQIRYGQTGQAAAAAVWLVVPCAELYQDERADDTVDLAIGTEFTALARSEQIDAVLAGLRPDATAPPDLTLLPQIHAGAC